MTKKRLNILFLSSWYPSRAESSLGNFVQRHAEAVALNSNTAALFVCSDSSCKQKFEITESTINNVVTVNVYYKKVEHAIPFISQFQKALRYILGHFKGLEIVNQKFGKIDLVHHNILYPSGMIAWYLKKFKNIPYISTENWTGYLPSDGSYKGFFRKFITKTIANNAAFLTPVSLDLQKAMTAHGFKSNYAIVPNVVDTNLFYPKKNKSPNPKPLIIHISTLDDPQKNISGILRSVKKLKEKKFDFELFIVGENPERNKLEQLAESFGMLNTSVFFLGQKLKEELAEILRQSDFFILFSNYENLPCVVIESIASGIPVIASSAGGTPEHISDKLGIIVEPKDEAGFEKAMEWMIQNYSKFDTVYLRKYAVDHFSCERVGEQFQNIYTEVLNRLKN